jgi:hypothetical protein
MSGALVVVAISIMAVVAICLQQKDCHEVAISLEVAMVCIV